MLTYFFLKAVIGDADLNNDKQITFQEIYNRVAEIPFTGVRGVLLWYARLGSNQRLPAPEAGALSTELRAQFELSCKGLINLYRQIVHRRRYVKGDDGGAGRTDWDEA
jgi:hypothetical protein